MKSHVCRMYIRNIHISGSWSKFSKWNKMASDPDSQIQSGSRCITISTSCASESSFLAQDPDPSVPSGIKWHWILIPVFQVELNDIGSWSGFTDAIRIQMYGLSAVCASESSFLDPDPDPSVPSGIKWHRIRIHRCNPDPDVWLFLHHVHHNLHF